MKNLLTYLILLIVATGCGGDSELRIIEQFSKEDWSIKDGEFPYNHRMNYVGDLDKNHLKVGMTRKDIIDLLGESEKDVKRLIGYNLFERVDSANGDFITTELNFLLDKEGRKAIRIYYQEEIEKELRFPLAYESVTKYAKENLDSNYTLLDQSAGLVNLYFDKDGKRVYEQKHLGVPIHVDSMKTPYFTYYLLNDKLEVIDVSRKSFKGLLREE